MQPWIRRYNYIQDWFYTQHQIYAKHHVGAYPVTYYKIDLEHSVYDKSLMAGSYELHGVGELSGIQWVKIKHLPVYFTSPVTPLYTADESGVTMGESMHMEVVIPSEYGFEPSPWDYIYFSQDFMFKSNNTRDPIFVVKNSDPSTWGDITYYRVSIKPAPVGTLEELDKQVVKEAMFIEFTKKIHSADIAFTLLKLLSRYEKISKNLNENFHSSGVYLVDEIYK